MPGGNVSLARQIGRRALTFRRRYCRSMRRTPPPFELPAILSADEFRPRACGKGRSYSENLSQVATINPSAARPGTA
jgi:hypothetical protein